MTREEFDHIDNWDDLLTLCYDYDCDYCEDIYTESNMDDGIWESINDWSSTWEDLRDYLNNQPNRNDLRGYTYFHINDNGDFELTSDGDYTFEGHKSDIREWMEDHDYFELESALEKFRKFEYEDPEGIPLAITANEFTTLFV